MIRLINIAIVDDNAVIRDNINSTINRVLFSNPIEYTVVQYESSEQFLDKINIMNHNLLFLDIELPGMSGIDLAQIVSKRNKECLIIFLTSFDYYMKDAFGINVYRYILKSEYDKLLPTVLYEVINLWENKEKRIFKVPDGVLSIFLEDIIYIEFLERNPYLTLKNHKKIKLSATSLSSVYKYVNSIDFIKINNHTIVNMRYITEILYNSIFLDSLNQSFNISRGKFKEILKTYQNYLIKGNTL